MNWNWTEIVLVSLRGLIVLAFVALGWRDIGMLFRRPARMGTGLARAWAVSRATMLEAWAGRVWLLPVLWLAASLIMISVVRPFTEEERIPLYIRVLLMGQEMLVLVMMGVMACVSYPRERERKIVVTNASKPLSRLEMVLGKMMGFSAMAGMMIVVMGVASLLILEVSDRRLRARAEEQYRLAKDDYSKRSTAAQAQRLAEEGSLFAYNYIGVPANGMSIAGFMDNRSTPPMRWLKGGSDEIVFYKFSRVVAPAAMFLAPPGVRPYFYFHFSVTPYAANPPKQVQIQVTAARTSPHLQPQDMRVQQKTLTLNSAGEAKWEPDRPEELFTPLDPAGQIMQDNDMGEVTVSMRCTSSGVFLQIADGMDPDPATGQVPGNAQFNVEARFPTSEGPGGVVPRARPAMHGLERYSRQEISGFKPNELTTAQGTAPLEEAVFHFSGDQLRGIPLDSQGNFTLSLRLEENSLGNAGVPTEVGVQVFSADSPADVFVPTQTTNEGEKPTITLIEKRLMTVKVPGKHLGNPDESKRGDLYVILTCETPQHFVSLVEGSVRLELPRTPFFINLFKSELVMFLEATLLIVVCVTCSVRLGWPVAMLLAVACYMFGLFAEFIQGLERYGGLGSLGYSSYGVHSSMYQFLDTATGGIWKALEVIAVVAPSFTIYQPMAFITDLRNMPLTVLAGNVGWTIAFALPFLAIAHLLARKQELG